jgi:LacI family transcriptional regulator
MSGRKIYSRRERRQEAFSTRARWSRDGDREVELSALTRSGGGSVTLRDVAEASGVSITTVSRILNGRESGVPIREETRQRVLAAAAELGYRPNLLARGLRGSRSSLLGVIARDVTDPFHVQILRGINDALREREYRMFLGHVDYRPDEVLSYGSMFEHSHADGIIVIGDLEGGDPALAVLAGRHRYVVGVTDRVSRREVPGVYGDSVEGTRLALEHLWSLGHRRIACVSDDRTSDGLLRMQRYETFMREHGAGDAIDGHVTDLEPEPSYRLGMRLFRERDDRTRPTAIYATSDTIAIGLMQAAYQSRIPIPDGISIVGFDDIDFAAFAIPPLTTISQRGIEMGREAAEMLLGMIEQARSGDQVEDIVLNPTLVVRGSTAAPRS